MLALLVIIFLAGIYILAKGKINVSKEKELARPESIYIGLAMIILAVLPYMFNVINNMPVVIGVLTAIIVYAFLVSKKVSV